MHKCRLVLALLVLPFLLMANSCSSDSNGQANKKKILISTDIAAGLVNGLESGPPDTDDPYAVELMSTYADAEVLGAVVVKGNDMQPAELFAANETFIATPGFWNGPIFAGGIIPLSIPNDVEWTGGLVEESLPQLFVNEGVLTLANILANSEEKITILAIGPLTDIACLVLNFPDVLGNIKELVFLGGRLPNQVLKYTFSDVVFTDFNVAQDERAANIVFEQSDIPITLITFSISMSALYMRAQIDSLLDPGCTQRAQLLSRASQIRMNYLQEEVNLNGMDSYDINAAYYVAKPEMFICEEAGFEFVQCAVGTPGVYNGADNPCAGHGPDQGSDLNNESEQLWADPSYLGQSRAINSCISYINQEELDRFETGTIAVFCDGGVWSELPD
jgi:pyrimidine-specific ribonucleoside hydrolase